MMASGRWPRAYLHPLWWGALALLLFNDHLLKGAGVLPGWLTGKLSDVAGLIVLPPLLALLLGAQRRGGRLAALAISGAALASVNVWPAAARALEQALGVLGMASRVWVDPTDLLALPALLLAAPLCVPAQRREVRGLSLGVQRLGVALAALACVATTGNDDDDSTDENDGPALVNRSADTITVLIASTENAGGCRLYRQERVTALTTDAFVNRREVTLEQDERTPLAEHSPTNCGAAWVQLPDGDELFVYWRDLDPIEGFVPEDDSSRLARLIEVEGREGRYTTDQGDELARFELADEEPPETTCPEEEIVSDLSWTSPAVSQGFFELDEVRDLGGGCFEVDWVSQSDETAAIDTQQICLPEWAFPFEEREVLSVVVDRSDDGGRRLQISRFEEGAVTLKLVMYSEAGEALLSGSPVTGMEADDCFGVLSECGAYLRPADLSLKGDDAPLRGGDDTEIEDFEGAEKVRILVGPSRWVDWSSAACEGFEASAGPAASWLELHEY